MGRIKAGLTVMVVGLMLGFGAVSPAAASGLKTHLWIAEQILADLRPDCAVTLDGQQYTIAPTTCRAILNNPAMFRAGALGPDAYPDIISGQVTVHPGIEGDWQTSDWLRHIYTRANSQAEVAFAAGYLVHAATDTFAHTYVNGYAGDIFDLGDERAVELRHFVLEKYIDAHLPAAPSTLFTLDAPNRFLAENLILNPDAARNARRSGTAIHISAMYEVYRGVGELEDSLDALEAGAGEMVALLAGEHLELAAKIADGELSLQVANDALGVREQQLQIEQATFDAAKKVLDDALDAIRRNEQTITLSAERVRLATEGIEAARRAATEANNAVDSLERSLSDLRREIASVPARECRNVVESVCTTVCNFKNICGDQCRNVTRLACSPTDAWSRLNDEIGRVEGRLRDARRRIVQAGIDESAHVASRAAALQAKLEAEARRAALDLAGTAADAAYQPIRLRYELELAATQRARQLVSDLRDELERFRRRFLDIEGMQTALAELIAHSDILSGYASNWRKGIEVATEEYIQVATEVATGLAKGEGGGFGAYAEWLSCYGGAFTPVPYQAGEFACNAVSAFEEFNAALDQLVLDLLPEPFATLYREYLELRADVKSELRGLASDAAVELAKMAAPDQSTREFIDLLANPQNATASRMNDIYDEIGDAGGKPLLTFERVSDLINADAGISGGALDPERFSSLRHSGVLARYALLDRSGVDLVTWRLGGRLSPAAGATTGRYSVLFEMLRSIDGNHQWQPYGLPYARTSGPPQPDAADRHYGWGPLDGGPTGMPIFADEVNRRRVFRRLFPTSVAGSLAERPELNGSYPFPECARHPFPVTFNTDGSPAAEDRTCAGPVPPEPFAESVSATVTRWWRSLLNFVGYRPSVVTQAARDAAKAEAERTNLHPVT